ncbi:MAG: hypothetical protein ACT4QB_15565, partial [Gammaproteobacteria bacterium]
ATKLSSPIADGNEPSSPARRFWARPVKRPVGHIACENSDWHMASDCYGLTKCLDTLNLVHGLSREIRLTAMRT